MPSWIDILTGSEAKILLFRRWQDSEPCMKEDWPDAVIFDMMRVRLLGFHLIPESILDCKNNLTFDGSPP